MMFFTVEMFGVVIFRIGIGPQRKQQWISNTDGSFELAPQVEEEEYEYEEEEYRFGFR